MPSCTRENPHEPARFRVDLEKLAKLDNSFNKIMSRIPGKGSLGGQPSEDEVVLKALDLAGISSMELLKQAMQEMEEARKEKEG